MACTLRIMTVRVVAPIASGSCVGFSEALLRGLSMGLNALRAVYVRVFSPLSNQSGATMVEFAATLPFFLLLMVGFGELCALGNKRLMLEHAVTETARWAIIGKDDFGTATDDRVAAIKQKAVEQGQLFGVAIRADKVTICPLSGTCTPATSDAGEVSEFIRITITTPLTYAFLKLDLNLKTEAVVRNEPFDG